MKRIFLLCICIPFIFSSCSKSSVENDELPEKEKKSEYYIKYKASSSRGALYLYHPYYIDDKGERQNMNERERVIGPVPFGFESEMGADSYDVHLVIECSKDGGPFAFKVENRGVEAKVKYKIDF